MEKNWLSKVFSDFSWETVFVTDKLFVKIIIKKIYSQCFFCVYVVMLLFSNRWQQQPSYLLTPPECGKILRRPGHGHMTQGFSVTTRLVFVP